MSSIKRVAMKFARKKTEEMKRSNRTAQAHVMLSPEEKLAFLELAEKRGTDLSDLVRQLLHRELKLEKKSEAA